MDGPSNTNDLHFNSEINHLKDTRIETHFSIFRIHKQFIRLVCVDTLLRSRSMHLNGSDMQNRVVNVENSLLLSSFDCHAPKN